MNTRLTMTSVKKGGLRWALSAAAAAGLLCLTGRAYCDDPVTMAPPIDSYSTQSADNAPPNAGPDTVFKWSEVPADQQVPIRRAVFDQGGYQLYDNAGETIVVPFTNQNLYVMKFALSTNGTTYFVNEGDVPVLYVPQGGYLENATVPGARWFPFSEKYHPSQPVFLGIAPSWTTYVNMGWYPGMYCHGGYWGENSYVSGGLFLPTIGLFFEIGGRHYDGWERYHDYYDYHPAPYRIGYFHRDVYRWSDRPYWVARPFEGAGHRDGGYRHDGDYRRAGNSHAFGGDHAGSGDHRYVPHRTFGGDHAVNSDRPFGTFRADGVPTVRRSNSFGQGRTFQGARPIEPGRTGGADHNFSGGRSDGQGRTFGGRTFGGGQPATNGSDRTYRSSRPAENNRGFGSGRSYSNAGNRPSTGDSRPSYSANRGRADSGSDHSSRSNGNNRSSGSDNRSSGGGNNHSFSRGGYRSR